MTPPLQDNYINQKVYSELGSALEDGISIVELDYSVGIDSVDNSVVPRDSEDIEGIEC